MKPFAAASLPGTLTFSLQPPNVMNQCVDRGQESVCGGNRIDDLMAVKLVMNDAVGWFPPVRPKHSFDYRCPFFW